MSEAEELIKYIAERVEHYKTFYSIKIGQAFMLWYAVEALGLDQDTSYEAVSYDGGNDKGIDLFYIDEEFERVIISEGKYNGKGQNKPTVGEFLELLHTTDWLRNPEALQREGREDLAAAAADYSAAIGRGFSVEYVFIYMGAPKKELIDAANQFNASEAGNLPSRSARIVSLDLLQHIHDEYIDKSTRISEERFIVPANQVFEESGAYGKALVVSVPGAELRRLYETHRDTLFDRNVRLFLGARKGGVNAGIRDTLESVAERRNFWAYNNGITFVCDRYEFDDTTCTVALYNFSIVNGCQTTVSIANAIEAASREVSDLARIIASSQEPVVNSIITYTNRQNPIQPWDINSQDKLQKRLKKELAEDQNPYFYILRLLVVESYR